MSKFNVVLTAAVSMLIGVFIGEAHHAAAFAQGAAPKPAYMVVSAKSIHPDQMAPYRQAAGPLARAAGMENLASGDPALHVLEGKWSDPGATMTIERYRSMGDLLAFWNSPGYQQAKKLREGHVQMNFIVAVEGR